VTTGLDRMRTFLHKAGYRAETPLPTGMRWFLVGTVVTSFGNGAAAPFLAIHLVTVGALDEPLVAIFFTVLGSTSVVLSPAGGHLVDRWGARLGTVSGSLVQGTGFVVLAVAHSFPTFLLGAVVTGAGNALFFPARSPALVAMVEAQSLTRAFSARFLANNIGAGAGIVTAGLLVTLGGAPTNALLFINAISTWTFALVLHAVVPRATVDPGRGPRGEERPARSRAGIELGSGVLRLIAAHTFIAFFAVVQLDSTVPLALSRSADLDILQISLFLGAGSVLALVIQMPIGRLVDRLGSARAFRLQMVLWAAAWACGAAAAWSPGGTHFLLISMICLVSVAECTFAPALNGLVVSCSTSSNLGRVNGLISGSYSAALVWGPALGLGLLERGSEWFWIALLTGAAAGLLCTTGLHAARPHHPSGA